MATDFIGRFDGPLHFRLILQPLMSAIFAIRDGVHDAHSGGSPYFWTLLTDSTRSRDLLVRGWAAVGKVFIFAVVLDAVYQLIALHWFYPGEALLTAAVLALIPYLILRGPVNRISQLWMRRRMHSASHPAK